MKKLLTAFTCLGLFLPLHATDVNKLRMAGPYQVRSPFIVDSLDAAQNKYSVDQLINSNVSFEQLKSGRIVDVKDLPQNSDSTQTKIVLASFDFVAHSYVGVDVKVDGAKSSQVYVNNRQVAGNTKLQPGQYTVVLKYVADTAHVKIALNADKDSLVTLLPAETVKRPFSMADNMQMKHYNGVSVSPSGKYALVSVGGFNDEGVNSSESKVIDIASKRTLMTANGLMRWMPKSDLLLDVEFKYQSGKANLFTVNPVTMECKPLAKNVPNYQFYVSPTEDFLIMSQQIGGPQKEQGVYEILTPDDRQPGWRDRDRLLKYDLKTGLLQPLTYGFRAQWLFDISKDGKYLLFGVNDEQLTKQPYSMFSAYRMNLATLETEMLFEKEAVISSVLFAGGNDKLLVKASANAFSRIGCTLPDTLMPNEYDYQLFLFDCATKKAKPVTRNFNPAVSNVVTSTDNVVYFTAENADSISLYKLDLKSERISAVAQPCEVISSIAISRLGNTIVYAGSGACTADRLYAYDVKSRKVAVLESPNAERMAQIEIGECRPLRFMSKRGYELTGHYYLPAHFDASKKYPVIVHYYGGCSPTSRRFGGGSHYPAHYWNAMGYVVLIVNPSGASGFGQEWASRHVNTMGEGVAEDIIEATQYFIDRNPWVNAKKIGCVSASYGGFMTQLLLTKTDMFAAGVSHAGISDHTSYWGEGYWGYTYSQVSAANSFPWTRKDLYVDRSPLYNADKIHT
ncbi:MAG: S9 family peptidase, partial [Bacteroidaceae bacterium]|nr:S9 family peptidase [Bacteroidaceae bacterium]